MILLARFFACRRRKSTGYDIEVVSLDGSAEQVPDPGMVRETFVVQ